MSTTHKKFAVFVLVLVTVVLLVLLARFVWHRHLYAVTNAVFVETDSLVFVSFDKVGGKIERLHKEEGERVAPGELLAELDSTNYELKAEALREAISGLKRRVEALELEITRAEKDLEIRERKLKKELERLKWKRKALLKEVQALEIQISQLERDFSRTKRLFEKELVPKRRVEELETRLEVTKKKKEGLLLSVKGLEAAIESLKKDVELVKNAKKGIRAKRKELEALRHQVNSKKRSLEDVEILVENCRLKSPVSGYIAKKFHSVGDVVGPGEPVYAVVDFSKLYVLVLLEETKLRGVVPGCEAKIKIDAYPGVEFKGVVEAVLPATAAKFALVPRDVSAGEFTKVAQRIPVKIRIIEGDVSLLRVGLGGEVEIRRKF